MTDLTCTECGAALPPGRRVRCSKVCEKRWSNRVHRATFEKTCKRCGASFTGSARRVYCPGSRCRALALGDQYRKQPVPTQLRIPFESQRGALRVAIEEGDTDRLLDELRRRTERVGDCWIWQGRTDSSGYPIVQIARRRRSLHRIVATVIGGEEPGFRPVHHTCANRQCVNPVHLQIVQPHENTAEMLERNYYLARIAELEREVAKLRRHRGWGSPSSRGALLDRRGLRVAVPLKLGDFPPSVVGPVTGRLPDTGACVADVGS